MRLHRFAGEGDHCRLLIGEGARFCGHESTHPIHTVDVDPPEVIERREIESRRDHRNIEVGNPRLVDPER
jgi:hypothetical protein